jgi:(S)-3,5-dihydroxyphenylglycine transaminase
MTSLNAVVQRFPNAISFAPGWPSDRFCKPTEALADIERWVSHRAATLGVPVAAVEASLGQYGDTAGMIRDLLARHLDLDLGIHANESDIVVTTGAQEAMLIAALALLEPATDSLLVSDPSYIGITGIATLLDIPIYPVSSGSEGLRVDAVARAVRAVMASGRRPRALYDVPDFHNPLGSCMPIDARRELLALAEQVGMMILEDNPYGAFAYDHSPLPTLKALDSAGAVLYIGTFAKTLFPGLRIGYLVAGQEVAGTSQSLAAVLATVKSLTTVNTSPILQAAAGAALLQRGGSLRPLVEVRMQFYRGNRDCMLAALSREFPSGAPWAAGVEWNKPTGGFFIVMTLPFEFSAEELERCARDFGVIVSPMIYFALSAGRACQIRLSFSYVDAPVIDEGVRRLATFVRDEVRRARAPQAASAPRVHRESDIPATESSEQLIELREQFERQPTIEPHGRS